MSTSNAVLYDAPGPAARKRNVAYTVVTGIAVVLIAWWVIAQLGANGQLDPAKWAPFAQSSTWTTYVLPGLWGTIRAAGLSIVFALVFGVVFGLGRLARTAPVRWICAAIVEFFRAIPVLMLMIFTYQLFAVFDLVPPRSLAFWAVVVSLTLYNGSVIAEILRAGIHSLPRGQGEAAHALGLSHWQAMWQVLLPQAVTAMAPALVAQMVIALKDSALGYQIGFVEVVRSGTQVASSYQNYVPALIVVAAIMIAINYALTAAANGLERWLRARSVTRATPSLQTSVLEAQTP